MDPCLTLLDRALKGDAETLSVLERVAAIYVYDGTNAAQPKICGAWDFLNQTLTEVERYESRIMNMQSNMNASVNMQLQLQMQSAHMNLEAHVQLLATMSRRAARRCPESDQKLVENCLSNVTHLHGTMDQHSKHFIDSNRSMRIAVMGRIAAIAFDFTNHRVNRGTTSGSNCSSPQNIIHSNHHQQHQSHLHQNAAMRYQNNLQQQQQQLNLYQTCFSNPVAMDSICSLIAANAISTGPVEFSSLVLEWIITSMTNLPPFSVSSVMYHLACEAVGKSAPRGTRDALEKLLEPVLSKVLAPMLQDAVRESDHGDDDGTAMNGSSRTSAHRIAAMTLKALERWCAATSCSITRLRLVCKKVNINIIAAVSDAMYSDSELVMDALTELLDTLLRRNAQDQVALEQQSVVENVFSFGSPAAQLKFEQDATMHGQERDDILSELISAVGLQRFRFMTRLASGDSGVCRCLASIARAIASASQPLLRTGRLEGAENGMIELLLKATSHPSMSVHAVALDAFKFVIIPTSDVPTRLLPILQGKAIVPPSIVGLAPDENLDIDFHEFERFREHQLADVLADCYINCRSYYMESCCIAIEEFCSTPPNHHTPFQLEAALFCLCAVSVDASKRALLVNASPAAQAAAAKACASQISGAVSSDLVTIAEDAKHHDDKLSRSIFAIAKSQSIGAFENPLFLSQLCRLLGKYANWLSKSPTAGVLDAAATLSLSSFNQTASNFGKDNELLKDMTLSPFTEAATALRNIMSRAPAQFANADALSALERGWRSIYVNPCGGDEKTIASIDDRKALCSGITRVLTVLAPDQWSSSVATLTTPTIECIETLVKAMSSAQNATDNTIIGQQISRMSEEICVLASALRIFHTFAKKQVNVGPEQVKAPLLSLLHRIWPCITHIAKHFTSHEIVTSSLNEFLLIVISLNDDGKDLSLLSEACEIAVSIIDAATAQEKKPASFLPILEFVGETVDIFGHQAEVHATSLQSIGGSSTEMTHTLHRIIENLMRKIFVIVQVSSVETDANMDVLPGVFSVCRACIRRCPLLLITLNLAVDGANGESVFTASLNAAMSSIRTREVDVVRAALMYLNDAFLLAALSGQTADIRYTSALKCIEAVKPFRGKLISTLICGACGVFPREVLDPAGGLLHSILKSTGGGEAEQMCILALNKESFRLGDHAKYTTLSTLGTCAQGTIAPSVLMDLLDDLWTMHQNDDNGGIIAGGDAILSFAKKYSN